MESILFMDGVDSCVGVCVCVSFYVQQMVNRHENDLPVFCLVFGVKISLWKEIYTQFTWKRLRMWHQYKVLDVLFYCFMAIKLWFPYICSSGFTKLFLFREHWHTQFIYKSQKDINYCWYTYVLSSLCGLGLHIEGRDKIQTQVGMIKNEDLWVYINPILSRNHILFYLWAWQAMVMKYVSL